MRYEIRKAESEVKFKDRNLISEGITQTYRDDIYSKTIKEFKTKSEALEELKNYESKCEWYNESRPNFRITEYYVIEVGADKWGEDEDLDIWEFAPMDLTKFNEVYGR